MSGEIIDISQLVDSQTVVWPGDTVTSHNWVMTMKDGASCNVSTLNMSVHCGTHSDAPYHYLEDGMKSAEVPLETYLGRCVVVDAEDPEAVRPSDFADVDFSRIRRILFRTKRPNTARLWRDDFTYMSVEAATALRDHKVLLVGLDTPSMDPMTSKTLEAHKTLAAAGTLFLENLKLDHVECGEYELIALPLKLGESDSSPVRAILRTLS